MQDFVIAIPSYRRESMIEVMTLALLDKQQIPRDKVYIFVADAKEHQRYSAKLGDRWPNIITGVAGLWRQRNFITDYFPEGQHVVSLDDDVEEIFRLHGHPIKGGELEPLHPGGLMDIIRDAGCKMQSYNVFLWSFNVSDNVYYMGNVEYGRALTMSRGLCNGFFWGCLNRRSPELRLAFGDGHEDVERTCRYIQKDGAVFRYREFCAKTKCQSNPGGLQASLTSKQRRLEEERGAKLLVDAFPLLLRLAPDSKLGVKFMGTARSLLDKHSILSLHAFLKMAAQKKLELLVRSHCVFLSGNGAGSVPVPCRVDRFHDNPEAFGLTAGEQRHLCIPCRTFVEALKSQTLFVVWMPPEACQQLGLEAVPALEELPGILRAGTSAVAAPLAGGSQSPAPAFPKRRRRAVPEEQSTFSRYLDSLVPGQAAEVDDDEEEEPASGATVVLEPPCLKNGPSKVAKVALKRKERHEDEEWIQSQREQFSHATLAAVDPLDRSVDLFAECEIHTDFEVHFAGLCSELESKEVPAAPGMAKSSSAMCVSRIWAGGWGTQCTHVPVPGLEFCKIHCKEIERQGYLTHGRFDGPIPPKKRMEFQKHQDRLRRLSGAAPASNTLGDSTSFCEERWRTMARAETESARAYEFRTGIKVRQTGQGKKRLKLAE